MTTKKVSELTNEELNEQVALAAEIDVLRIKGSRYLWTNEVLGCRRSIYEPTANTVDGRSQCLEVFFKLVRDGVRVMDIAERLINEGYTDQTAFNLRYQRAICEALVQYGATNE